MSALTIPDEQTCGGCLALETKLRLLEGAERRAEIAARDHGRAVQELERCRAELAATKEALRALEARLKRNARGKK